MDAELRVFVRLPEDADDMYILHLDSPFVNINFCTTILYVSKNWNKMIFEINRTQCRTKWKRMWGFINNQDVGSEAATI